MAEKKETVKLEMEKVNAFKDEHTVDELTEMFVNFMVGINEHLGAIRDLVNNNKELCALSSIAIIAAVGTSVNPDHEMNVDQILMTGSSDDCKELFLKMMQKVSAEV